MRFYKNHHLPFIFKFSFKGQETSIFAEYYRFWLYKMISTTICISCGDFSTVLYILFIKRFFWDFFPGKNNNSTKNNPLSLFDALTYETGSIFPDFVFVIEYTNVLYLIEQDSFWYFTHLLYVCLKHRKNVTELNISYEMGTSVIIVKSQLFIFILLYVVYVS